MRERPGRPPELLMVERTAAMAFAGGALVFPGGRIDDGDRALATAFPGPDAAARIAAIRETLEESGVPVGIDPVPGQDLARLMQDGLLAGEPFGQLIADHGLGLHPDILTAFARWRPAFHQPRIFDTLFFIGQGPPGDWTPRPQESECESVEWLSATDVLGRIADGRASAIFPTLRNLERLAQFDDFVSARSDALAHPVETITPWLADHDGEPHLFIPEGLGYPITREPLASVRRGGATIPG